MRPRGVWSRRAALAGAALLVGLALAEAGLRLAKWAAPDAYPLNRLYLHSELRQHVGGYWAPSRFSRYELQPGYRGTQLWQESSHRRVAVRVNDVGLRGPETTVEKPEGTRRLLVLGDSFTFGWNLAEDETYPAVLQELLRRRDPRIEVLNAGFADGMCPDEHHVWLANRGLQFAPDLVVYAFFIGNDVGCAFEPHWRDLDARGLPRRIANDGVWIEDGFVRVDDPRSDTAGQQWYYRAPLLRETYLAVLVGRGLARLRRAHFDPEYAPRRLRWCTSESSTPEMLEHEARFFRLVEGMAALARERGAGFRVALLPMNFMVHPHLVERVETDGPVRGTRAFFDKAIARLAAASIETIDLLPELQERGRAELLFPAHGETHFNRAGARAAAEILAARLGDAWAP